MFGNWLKNLVIGDASETLDGAGELERALRAELPAADDETILVIAAMVGLLGAVAYADGDFSLAEQQHVRAELGRINGMSPSGAEAASSVLKRHVREIAAVHTPRYCRVLRELADRELRVQVLEMLFALAAADENVTNAETNSMRQIATSLGLTQSDYNSIQAKYKHHLAVLRGNG
jgi:uncharacterized tellurite resistance protein B-like protein